MGITLRRRALIMGWYGTETIGDKAILGGIMRTYRRNHPGAKIVVASLYPFYTRNTIAELDEQAEVIPVPSAQFLWHSAVSDDVILGGGPLMDMEALYIPLWSFLMARLFGKRRVVWGCGLGPLKQSKYVEAVRQILTLATAIELRDSASVQLAREMTGREDILQVQDPATGYLQALKPECSAQVLQEKNIMACFLREWPRHFAQDLSEQELQQTRTRFEVFLAVRIKETCRQYRLQPVFYAMSDFVPGGDDRDFNRQFVANYFGDFEARLEARPGSVKSIVTAMMAAKICLCMRFHSVLFAHTLGRNYLAVDYTVGGKIHAFLKDEGAASRSVSLLDLSQEAKVHWNSLCASYFE